MQVRDRILPILTSVLDLDKDRAIHDGDRLVADLEADSIDMMEIMIELEDEFEMDISDHDAEMVVTVGDIVQMVEAHHA